MQAIKPHFLRKDNITNLLPTELTFNLHITSYNRPKPKYCCFLLCLFLGFFLFVFFNSSKLVVRFHVNKMKWQAFIPRKKIFQSVSSYHLEWHFNPCPAEPGYTLPLQTV